MNSTVLLMLALLSRDRRRDGRHDRFRLFEEFRAILPATVTSIEIWALVDVIENRERNEGSREMLPMIAAMLASQGQTSAATSTSASTSTAPTTVTTTGIDPTAMLVLAMVSQSGNGW